MATRKTILTAVGVLAASYGWALAQTEGKGEDAKREPSASSRAVRPRVASENTAAELLRKRVDKVDWTDITFDEVITWLRDQAEDRVNVLPRWRVLSGEGVDAEKTVTLQLRNSTVADVLNEVMDQLAEEGRVTYHAMEDKLQISARADFDRKLYERVYVVTDVVFQVPDFGRSAPTIDLQQAGRNSGSGGGGGSSQSVFGGSGGGSSQQDLEEEEDEVKERLEALRRTIMRTVAPETWGGEGADAGTQSGPGRIELFNNRALVVYNTIEVHEMIIGYFTHH
ncbi:MAG: hypothetical protein HY763_03390 [Planctomycetes bacterium]|nr:hypothetical protein [Planctomycetota bacterium]